LGFTGQFLGETEIMGGSNSLQWEPIYLASTEDEKCWYRYEDQEISTGYFDEYENHHPSEYKSAAIHLRVFIVEKETPCGVWLAYESGLSLNRWVSKTSRKKYAFPTKEEAWDSFIARKTKQRRLLFAQLQRVEALLELPAPTTEQIASHKNYQQIASVTYLEKPLPLLLQSSQSGGINAK
jgi:hypothetical protein